MQRPSWVTDETEWIDSCRLIVEAVDKLLSGQIGIIECSRELSKLAIDVRAEWDADFVTFRGIASETDDVPVGNVRALWDENALELKEESARAYLDEISTVAMNAARNLKNKYGK